MAARSRRHGRGLPPTDGSDVQYFCVPIPVEKEYRAQLFGMIRELGFYKQWDPDPTNRRDTIAAWWQGYFTQFLASITGGCQNEDECRDYSPAASILEYYPCSPFQPDCELPAGYTYEPFTIVDNTTIGTIIGQYGLGYQVGDVYTDLTKLPQGSWENVLEGYNFFPRITITTPAGSGTVNIEFLNIPQGGRALVLIDDYFDLLHLNLVELNKDTVSFPPETTVPFVVPYEITGDTVHTVKVIFLPTVDDTPLPVFFGGGIRSVQLCGFGSADPMACCPADTRHLRELIRLANDERAFILRIMDDGTPESFAPDAPDEFDSDPADTNPAARSNALCNAVRRYVLSFIDHMVETYAQADAVTDILEGFPFFNPITGLIDIAVDVGQGMIAGLANDQEAIDAVICHMADNLRGEVIERDAFRDSVSPSSFDIGSNEFQIAVLVDMHNAVEANYRAFVSVLGEEYDRSSGGAPDECNCECAVEDINLVADSPFTTVTRLSANTFHIESTFVPGNDPAHPGAVFAQVRDEFLRCINISFTEAQSDYSQTNCAGEVVSGTGGGGGDGIRFGWRKFDGVPIDTIATVLCIEE